MLFLSTTSILLNIEESDKSRGSLLFILLREPRITWFHSRKAAVVSRLSKLAIGTTLLHSDGSRSQAVCLGSLGRGRASLQCHPLFLGNGQAVDTQVVADAIANIDGPARIYNGCECKVSSQEPELRACGQTRETNVRQVDENAAEKEWSQHDSPHGEVLASKMRKNDFGCHAAESWRKGEAKQGQMKMGAHSSRTESENQYRAPEIEEAGLAEELLDHNESSNDETFGGAIEVEKNMGSVGTSAVRAPRRVEPRPMADVSRRDASVQLRLSMPWLFGPPLSALLLPD
ncbi:sn-1,2-diacylglycerol cholinephosphotransferas-like protein, partial [Aureobasidium melanogenum]